MVNGFWKRVGWRSLLPFVLAMAIALTNLTGALVAQNTPAFASQPATLAQIKQPPSEASSPNNGVTLGGKQIFTIDASVGLKSREERAKEIADNLKSVADDRTIAPDEIQVRTNVDSGTTEIYTGDRILFSIHEADAEANDESRGVIAQEYLSLIRHAIEDYREIYSPRSTLQGLGKTAIATLVIVLGFVFLKRLAMAWQSKIWAFNSNYVRSIRLGSRELIRADQISGAILQMAGFLQIFVVLTALSIYLNLVLGFFPQTQSISVSIFASILAVVGQFLGGIFSYIPNLLFLLVLTILAFYILKFTRFLFEEIEKGDISIPGFEQDWAIPTARITQFLIVTFFAVVAFPYLPGAGSQAFQGISLFLGLLISLGSSSAIANIVAGILLTYTRAFKLGDEVEISGVSGTVVEKGLVVTRLRTFKNRFVSIPNAEVLSSNVVNYRRHYNADEGDPPIIHIEVGFDYDLPWQTAHDILLAAAHQTDNILTEPAPWIAHCAFEDDGVLYELNVYTNTPGPSGGYHIGSDLRRHIQEQCNQAGINLEKVHQISMQTAKGVIPFVTQNR